ncbi:putative leucine-rich repeat domain superfamily [Helianthus annuus]|nr:putative leucine-rich repeat domain superfamily [Helianthus annuus]
MMFDCSCVGDLVNLEVLSFAHCGIRKLPSTIGNLRKLKLLDLTGCVDLHIDDGVFKSLENLEELYMRVSYGKAIRFTDANLEELKMLSRQLNALEVEFVEKQTQTQLKNSFFMKLDNFKISMGCLLEYEHFNESYAFKNTLKIVTEHCKDVLDFQIDALFKKTEKLHVQVKDMTRLEDISIYTYDQCPFLYLRDLTVSNCVELKYLFTIPVASGLRKLELLTVSSCSVLEALVHDHPSEINSGDEMIIFKELKFMSLKNLPNLVSLFVVDNVVELPQLVQLEVDGLPNFTTIYPDKNNFSAFLKSEVKIAKLEKLKIIGMEKLKQIWAPDIEEVNEISMLREIDVEGCDSLVNLFPTNPMRKMNHLERLIVKECGSIEVIFNIDLDNVRHEVEQVSNNSCLRSIGERCGGQ